MKKTKKLKQFVSGILCALFVATSVFVVPNNVAFAQDDDLPEDIQANKASFDTIDDVISTYETKYAGMTPAPTQYVTTVNGESRIKRINFIQYDTPLEVDGEVTLDIPEDIANVFRLFGDLRLVGTLANTGVEMYIVDPDGTEYSAGNIIGHKWQGEYKDADENSLWTTYTKMPWIEQNGSSIMTPWDNKDGDGNIDYSGYKLKLKGTGNLNFVYLWEENGMPLEYDTSVYSVMGKDKSTLNVKVNVDTTKNLSINGVNKFDEDIFKRYHVNSGPVQLFNNISDWILDDEVFFKTTEDWGFIPGRGAFHFPAAYDEKGGLVEDADNPGWSDFTETYKKYEQNDEVIDKYKTLFPSIGKDYCLTFDGWPNWQWEDPNSTSMETNFATPAYENFDAAADTAAKMMKSIDTRMGGFGPKYLEVKNESTISNEWDFFNTESADDAWDKLAEFHNKVADEVKEENPDVLVGGPSSAFMYLEKNDFEEAQHQLKFMDDTKDHLDWYSHHFYENSASVYVNDRTDNSDGFLAGRFEAVMDLLKAHMENTDNVKPILITEEGSYNSLGTDVDYFQKLVTFNGYMLRFMDYADSMDMVVPYIYPIISWKPNGFTTFYKYNATKDGILEEMTPLEGYLDMWKDFRGAYIPSDAECTSETPAANDDLNLASDRIFTKAVRNGDKVYLSVQNLNSHKVNLDLDVALGDGVSISSVTRKHYFLENANLTYEEVPVTDINNVDMRVEEMSVFEITLNDSPNFESELLRHVDYAKEELVASGENKDFTINTDTTDLTSSELRVDFGKTGSGFDGNMTVKINGTEIGSRSLEYTNKSGDVFTVVNFDVNDTSVIKDGDNIITVSMPEGGKISSVQLTNFYTKTAKAGQDTSPVKLKIEEAINNITDNVYISDDGAGIPEGSKWITQIEYDAYVSAIQTSAIVLKDTLANNEEINDAINTLDVAIEMFNKNQKDPIAAISNSMDTISFEDGETALYSLQNSDETSAEIVSDNGITDGSKALKYTVDPLLDDTNCFNYRKLLLTCPNSSGWDLSDGVSVDITNPNSVGVQVYFNVTDASGKTGFTWKMIPANSTTTYTLNDFSARANDWTNGSIGFVSGIDGSHITKIGFSMFEKGLITAGLTSCTLYFDNLQAVTNGPVAFDLVSFEDNETANYTVDTNDTTSEIVEGNGVTVGSKALKITALTTDVTWGSLSQLKFAAPEGCLWDFSNNNLKFDVTNPNDYDIKLAVFYDEVPGTNNSAWIDVPANSTINVDAAPYNPTADSTKITGVRIFISEVPISGKENVSFIIDNIRSDWTESSDDEPVDLFPAEKPVIDLTIATPSIPGTTPIDTPTTPDTSYTPDTHNKSATTANVEEVAKKIVDGDKLTIKPTSDNKTVKGDVLKEIKGKNVTVNIEVSEGVKWTFNGKDIPDNWSAKDINFNIDTVNSKIPADTLKDFTASKSSKTLSLDYDGAFGFEMTLTVHIGYLDAGKYANIYYYNPETGKLEFKQSYKINGGGDARFDFEHASDYVILVADKAASKTDTAVDTDNTTTDSTDNTATDTDSNPITGNNSTMPSALFLVCIASVAFTAKKKLYK